MADLVFVPWRPLHALKPSDSWIQGSHINLKNNSHDCSRIFQDQNMTVSMTFYPCFGAKVLVNILINCGFIANYLKLLNI